MSAKPMTKSLHTITAVKNVAAFVYARAHMSAYDGNYGPEALTGDALAILGYGGHSAESLRTTRDETLTRCVRAVAEILK